MFFISGLLNFGGLIGSDRYVIPIGGKNRYWYVIYFIESVSVRLKVSKSVRIGIG